MHQEKEYLVQSSKTVYIKKTDGAYQLMRNGNPFYIKGASGKSYIKELAEAGGNTLRVYDTINLSKILDEALIYNIAVIVDIPLPSFSENNNYYLDDNFNKEVKLKVKALVRTYKNHPALLFWNLGNEVTYPLPISAKSKKFIKIFNELVDQIHNEDPDHLVGTCIAGASGKQTFSINRNSPQLDVLGFNTFSTIEEVKSKTNKLSYLTSTIPYYISEWGNDGPWETELNKWMAKLEPTSTQKGETYWTIYNTYIKTDAQCMGSLAFYWGNKIEGTPTWFNIFDENGKKSEAYYSLMEVWSNSLFNEITSPEIEELKLDSKIDNNLVFNGKQLIEAEIYLNNESMQKFEFKWELYEDGWGSKRSKFYRELNESILVAQNFETCKVKFSIPEKEGAYRLFVYVYDDYNNFGTANIPFYVLTSE